MAFPHLNINTEKVVLEKFFIGMQSRIPMYVLQDLAKRHQDHVLRQGKLYTELSPIVDEMLIYLRAYLLRGMHTEKKTLTVVTPATWFDHLKYDMLASGKAWRVWLVKTFSPNISMTTKTEEAEVIRVCPHNDSYWSESDQHLHFLLWRYDNNNGNRLA